MGYTPPESTFRITFEDRPGLEVTAASLPMGEFLAISKLAATVQESQTKAGMTVADMAVALTEFGDLFRAFGKTLRTWNIEIPAGTPVPCSTEGLFSLETNFALDLFGGWMNGMQGVDAPLGETSPAGEQSVVASLPMEPFSPSRAS